MLKLQRSGRQWVAGFGLAVWLAILTGCSSTGEFKGQTTGAQASLTRKNFKMIKVNARGTSHGFRLLGFIPFANPNYAQAKARLYASVNQPLEGRATALVNQTEDRAALYFILFSMPRLTVTADVIEYLDEP
ncbi:MAG: hypothetical protein PCFJNLEI_03454 [Verrucomicrobiae bacterium]|nr:hypothetical protein [Verrucomicrobiae bacterium]